MLTCTRHVPAVTRAPWWARSGCGHTSNRSTTGLATSRTTTGARMRRSAPSADAPHPPTRSFPQVRATSRRDPTADRPLPARPVAAATADRSVIERRRLVAGLVFVVVLGLAVVIPLLLLRGGGQAPVAAGPAPTTTTPAPGETSRSTVPTAPSTSPSTTPPSTTPSTAGASIFTLPEGTKLQLGDGDPARHRRAPAGPVERRLRPGCGRRHLRSTHGSGCRRIPGSKWSLRRRSGRPRDRHRAERCRRGRLTPFTTPSRDDHALRLDRPRARSDSWQSSRSKALDCLGDRREVVS